MMRLHRGLALGSTLLGVLLVSTVLAQQGKEPAAASTRRLDPEGVSIQVLLGVGDRKAQAWNGRVKVDRGEVTGVDGYRFHEKDSATGPGSWKAESHVVRKFASKAKAGRSTSTGTAGPIIAHNGVVVSLKPQEGANLAVETDNGNFQATLAELMDGTPKTFLEGKVEVQRVADGVPLLEGAGHDDFPAAAADRDGGVWVAYVAHTPRGAEFPESFTARPKSFAEYAPEGGGDQVRLLPFVDGKAGASVDVTGPGLDVWRPAVAVAGDGAVVVAWSENRDGNWDLYSRKYDPARKSWSEPKRLTTNAGTDTDVVLATAPDGKVWMAWQGWLDGQADILFAEVDGAGESTNVSRDPGNDWSPSLAFGRDGRPAIAFDTYRAGNYDVMLWSASAAGAKLIPVAASAKYEARPTVAVDGSGRAWVAYEERDAAWGKDAENLIQGKGSTLYRSAAVRVRVVDGEKVREAPDPVARATELVRTMNSYPRISIDGDGRVWVAFRHRLEAIWGGPAVMVVGGVWLEYATALAGNSWEIPQLLPRSDGLLDARPALVAPTSGPLLAVYSSDGRLRHEAEFNSERNLRYWMHAGTPGGASSNEDLEVAALSSWSKGRPGEPVLAEVAAVAAVPAVHANEAADIARMRGHRIEAGGKTYRLLRGDFHRHTELSMDGGSDGSLEDMWRYAIDAAGLDWMGNNDHDNGGGKEYSWWLTQKTTDLYHNSRFTTMFSYERSNAYPHGHRNVMFPKRGVRTLPRLVDKKGMLDEDTPMLYDYLKEHGGLCASHTTATTMGTDWRDFNAEFEPMVEIFQGHRDSYEHLGAPRVPRRPGEADGGWKPLGLIWNALAMQYKIGFQASSDHISTHISFAVAIAEDASRGAVFDAFKRRHCYGATDNIVLDVRSGDHLMGDEFNAEGPVRLKVFAHGTRPITRVDIIKDFVYVYSTEPNQARVAFEWKDNENRPGGMSWYYVRVMQDDGELAWGSPFWVHFKGAGAGGE